MKQIEITTEMALHFAELYGLTFEVESFIQKGYTPKQALEEWDCLPTEKEIIDYLNN